MFNKVFGTSMATKCAPTIMLVSLEDIKKKLNFHSRITKVFLIEEFALIKEVFKPYMDDGFIFLAKTPRF